MIRVIECKNPADVLAIIADKSRELENIEKSAANIIAQVRLRGVDALREYTQRFDSAELTSFEVDKTEILDAYQKTNKEFLRVLEEAAANIELYHKPQLSHGYILTPQRGVVMGQRVIPLERVGVYVPGGTASYPSTVLMNVIPARLAGVDEIIVCSPPRPDGSISCDILAAAHLAGAHRVIKLGGAQAIAALAYGVGDIVPKVDKIVGPGNIYVAAAKRLVFGQVDIDMIAGPSDVLIIADSGADAVCVAADLLSQAEHDILSRVILVTPDASFVKAVCTELEKQLSDLPRSDIA